MILFKVLFLSIFAFAGPSDFSKVLKEAESLDLKSSKTYEEDQIRLFQESVVDVFYKKLIEDKKYEIKKDSNEFKQYIRAIGFLTKHSKDHIAASYVAEILEKTKMSRKDFWKIASKSLTKKIMKKLKSDYKIEVKEPQG